MNVKFKNLREPAHKIRYVQDKKEKVKKSKKKILALPKVDVETYFAYVRQLPAHHPVGDNVVAVLETDEITIMDEE